VTWKIRNTGWAITRYSNVAIDEARFLEEYDRAPVEEYGHGAG